MTRAPLGRVSISTGLNALGRRAVAFALSTLVVVTLTFIGLILLIVPGVLAALWHSLYAPVAIRERWSVWMTLRRARALFRCVWSTALIIAALQFALPVLVWIAAVDSNFVLRFDENWQPQEIGAGFSMSSGSLIYQLLNVVVTPLAGIMNAELYLKARHAGGEVVEDPL